MAPIVTRTLFHRTSPKNRNYKQKHRENCKADRKPLISGQHFLLFVRDVATYLDQWAQIFKTHTQIVTCVLNAFTKEVLKIDVYN